MSVLLKSFSPRASKLQSKESNKRLTKDYGWYNSFKANLSWGRTSDSWRPGNIWKEDICMWYTKGWRVIQWKISLPSTLTLGHPVPQLGHFRGMWQGHRFTWLLCEPHSAKDFVQKAHRCPASSALISSIYKQGDLLVAWSEQATAQSLEVIRDRSPHSQNPSSSPFPFTHPWPPHSLSTLLFPLPWKSILHHSSVWLTWLSISILESSCLLKKQTKKTPCWDSGIMLNLQINLWRKDILITILSLPIHEHVCPLISVLFDFLLQCFIVFRSRTGFIRFRPISFVSGLS